MSFSQAFSVTRALGRAWDHLRRAPAPLLVGGVLLMLLETRGTIGLNWELDELGRHEWLWGPLVLLAGLGCFLAIFFFVASSWIEVGFANTVDAVRRGEPTTVAHVFEARGRWLSMVIARLIVAVVTVVAVLPIAMCVAFGVFLHEALDAPEGLAVVVALLGALLYLPVLVYVALGLALTKLAVALEGLEPVAAIGRAWSLAAGRRLLLLWFAIATTIVAASGLIACGVGVLYTAPLARTAWVEAYLALLEGEGEHDGAAQGSAVTETDDSAAG